MRTPPQAKDYATADDFQAALQKWWADWADEDLPVRREPEQIIAGFVASPARRVHVRVLGSPGERTMARLIAGGHAMDKLPPLMAAEKQLAVRALEVIGI